MKKIGIFNHIFLKIFYDKMISILPNGRGRSGWDQLGTRMKEV